MCKKIISVVLCVAMLFSFSIIASAEDAGVAPAYNYTVNATTSLFYSNGTFYCDASLDGYSDRTTKIEITVTLQKKGLLWWNKVESWSGTFNNYYGSLSKSYATTTSGKYRVKGEFVAYSGSDSESITNYTTERSI